jgi:threonine/homoserine/homoserine lactone efflux protein
MSHQLLGFVGVSILITLVPGLDTALVTRNVVMRGPRAGVVTALGTSTGLFIHAAAVALGVSVILLRSATAFEAIKLGGAAYLGFLGLLALRASFRRQGATLSVPERTAPAPRRRPRLTHPYLQGLLTNVTNPKAVAFFLTFLPQFLGSGRGAVTTALVLAIIPVALSLTWLTLYAAFLGRIAAILRRPAVQRWQERVLGVVFIGFGVRLAAEHLQV